MTKFQITLVSAGIVGMGTLLLSAAPAFAATACGIGQVAGACQGAQNAGGGEWVPPTVSLQTTPAGSASISITGAAELDIPYYSVTADETITWYKGPGLVQSWSAPVGAGANAFVIPTANTAGQASVTLNVPGTTNESGDYLVSFPAMSAAGGVKFLSGVAPITFTGQGANTLPVTYSANEPIFSLSQNGPWTSTITVPAGVASWSNIPVNPAGLVTHATPAPAPSGATERWQSGPSTGSEQVLLPAKSPTPVTPTPVKKVAPMPKPTPKPQPVPVKSPAPAPVTKVIPSPVKSPTPTPVTKVTPTPVTKVTPTPQPTPVTVVTPKPAPKVKDVLNVKAPARAQFHQTIPVAIRLTKNGHPLADKIVRLATSGGKLAYATAKTNVRGIAHDSIFNAPTGKILITAHRAAITAGTVVLITAPTAAFPWWLVLILALAAAALTLLIIRRRRHADEQDEPTEE